MSPLSLPKSKNAHVVRSINSEQIDTLWQIILIVKFITFVQWNGAYPAGQKKIFFLTSFFFFFLPEFLKVWFSWSHVAWIFKKIFVTWQWKLIFQIWTTFKFSLASAFSCFRAAPSCYCFWTFNLKEAEHRCPTEYLFGRF